MDGSKSELYGNQCRKALENENSVFYYYQKLIQLRKEYDIFAEGDFRLLLEEDENIFAYVREYQGKQMLVVSNFTENTVPCTLLKEWQGGEVLICNYSEDGEEGMLRPYESAIYCCH